MNYQPYTQTPVKRFWRNRLENPFLKLSTLLLMLLPLFSLVLAIGFTTGFWGENTRIWHEQMRQFHPLITSFMWVISISSAWVLYLVYALIFGHALLKHNKETITFILRFAFCLAFVLLLAGILKVAFGMPRPGVHLPPAPFSFLNDFVSFPSGHTVQIITAALPLAFYFGKKWLFFAMTLLITLVGYSRLWLGMHHPCDVLGGMIVGSIIVILIFKPQTTSVHQA